MNLFGEIFLCPSYTVWVLKAKLNCSHGGNVKGDAVLGANYLDNWLVDDVPDCEFIEDIRVQLR